MRETKKVLWDRGELSPAVRRGYEDMTRLGREYYASAEKLKARRDELKQALLTAPAEEKKMIKARILLLEKEMIDARRTGTEAETFYLPGHRFLPHGRTAAKAGHSLC